MAAAATVTTSVHSVGGVSVTAFQGHDLSPCKARVWISTASVVPPLELGMKNRTRTCSRLLKLNEGELEGSGHYLAGTEAKAIVAAAASAPGAPAGLIVEGDWLVSPQLLSLLLLTWSSLPGDNPGWTVWRRSGVQTFTTMEEFDARASHIEAHNISKVCYWNLLLYGSRALW